MSKHDNLDHFLRSATDLPDLGIIGYAFAAGVKQLGREDALDAAIAGYVYARKAHNPHRGPFAPLAFKATEMERRRILKRRTRYRHRFNQDAMGDWDYATFRARGVSPAEDSERRDLVAFAFRCVSKLHPDLRAAVEAVHVRGLTLAEHGRELKRSHFLGNLRYQRAIAELRKMMAHAQS